MPLSHAQVELIKATAPLLEEHGKTIVVRFYSTLLSENPSLNSVFNQTNQASHQQASALATALYAYASNIDNLTILTPALDKICSKHVSLYVQPSQYAIVGKYLLDAMSHVLGPTLSPSHLNAWTEAYDQLAQVMISKEAALYQSCDSHGWIDWRQFRVIEKQQESQEITSFHLSPLNGEPLPMYRPGQYVSILVDVPSQPGFRQARQYSLSSAPNSKRYRISVRKDKGSLGMRPGYVSNALHENTKVGDVVQLSHPEGELFWDAEEDTKRPVVMISAGVGITPFISILDTMVEQGVTQRIVFVHGARTSSSRAFWDHLQAVSSTHPNIRYKSFLTAPTSDETKGVHFHEKGRISVKSLDIQQDLLLGSQPIKPLYFICGPQEFMLEIKTELHSLGIDKDDIRMELFGTGDAL
ncbi:related to globins and related hemoproteins [Ustilago trichophora]|uniref:nitric oxide dioxygenase n=1 Tax=Ustilago trichophora TaxID=86804 RepID=A0A5C3EGH2_9BASI|nr:related to globins and related hemoproteins [Ustilago trichophora]